MLTQGSLNAFVRGEAPLVRFPARLSPLEIRVVVVNFGVPDEVDVQPPLQVVSLPLPGIPQSEAFPIERLEHWVLDSLFCDVALCQVAMAVRHFVSNLHSHRSLRQRAHQRLQNFLGSIARFICVKECVQSARFIAGDKTPVGPDDAAVQIVSNRQEFAKGRLAEGIFPLAHGHWHSDSSAFRYSARCSESASKAQYTCGFI